MLAGFKEGGRVEIREEATGQAKHVYQFSSDGVSVNGAFRPASAGRARVPADDVAESGAGLLWREALLHEPAASDGRRQEAFIAASVAWRRNTAAPQRDQGQSRRIDLHEVFVGAVLVTGRKLAQLATPCRHPARITGLPLTKGLPLPPCFRLL